MRGHVVALAPQRCPVQRLGQQHLLREDEVGAVVVRHLVVVAHRDRVERARDLAVAAEDAARQVDLVDGGVALAGRDAVVGRVLGRHHADAVGGAGRGAEGAADALLEPRVLEAMQLVAAAEARVHRRLLLGVLDRHRTLDEAGEGRLEAAQRLAEGAVGAARAAGAGAALDGDDVVAGAPGSHVVTTRIAVTRALRVARGSRIFQPNDMSWSYRRRGSVARIQMKKAEKRAILASTTNGSTQVGGSTKGMSQPPRKIVTARPETTTTLRYSAAKYAAKRPPPYSVL